MNPNDEDYNHLSDVMYNHLANSTGDIEQKFSNNAEFVEVSQRILKREWDRIKKNLKDNEI